MIAKERYQFVDLALFFSTSFFRVANAPSIRQNPLCVFHFSSPSNPNFSSGREGNLL